MSLSQTAVLVFARAPVAGRCKTRLIPRYGARGAAAIHRKLVLRTLRMARAARPTLSCEPTAAHGFFHRCRRDFGVALQRQPSGDLGRKMALAITRALRGADKAIIVGTDCPALTIDDLHAAADALDHADVVLQPSSDGGYVLIGARRFELRALCGISWSSGAELEQTRQRLRRLGLSWRELPQRWDVDWPADVRRAKREALLQGGIPRLSI